MVLFFLLLYYIKKINRITLYFKTGLKRFKYSKKLRKTSVCFYSILNTYVLYMYKLM